MKIIELKSKSSKFIEFKSNEWDQVHYEHFGTELDPAYWKKQLILLKAQEGNKVLGILSGEIMAGVLHIKELIISGSHRNSGVGKNLLDFAEKKALELGAHTEYLETGSDWKAVQFYLKHGFKIVGKMDNFYQNKDFVLMQKFLI